MYKVCKTLVDCNPLTLLPRFVLDLLYNDQGRPQDFFQGVIGGGRGQWSGGTMASAEHEPITAVWGQSPQRGPGAEPLVRGLGGFAESILVIGCPTEPANLAPFQ